MPRKRNTAAGWEKELEGAKKVLAALYAVGPRDEKGELVPPYFGWARRLEGDVERLQKWLDIKIELTDKGKEATDGQDMSDK